MRPPSKGVRSDEACAIGANRGFGKGGFGDMRLGALFKRVNVDLEPIMSLLIRREAESAIIKRTEITVRYRSIRHNV